LSRGRVYISGPMEGYYKHNIKEFSKMQNYLKNNGFEVVNPFDIEVDKKFVKGEVPGRRDFLRKDIRKLTECDYIMMLNGWSRSHGAQFERMVAIEIGVEILYEDEEPNLRESRCS